MFSNPFAGLHSSYYDDSPSYYLNPAQRRHAMAQQQAQQQRALEEERARRFQRSRYLPDEGDDETDEDWIYRDALQRQQAYERRREEERVRQQREALQRQARNREHQPSPSPSPSASRPRSRSPINPSSPTLNTSSHRTPSPTAERAHPTPTPTPEEQDAARTIQTSWRALKKLKALEKEFDDLQKSFSIPTVVDFQSPNESIISVPVPEILPAEPAGDTPKLAYNHTNYALHSYVESLNRFLIKLDGVESGGNTAVRKCRRRIVGRVEAEANRIEIFGKKVWASHHAIHVATATDSE